MYSTYAEFMFTLEEFVVPTADIFPYFLIMLTYYVYELIVSPIRLVLVGCKVAVELAVLVS